jgi:hypothetical protein
MTTSTEQQTAQQQLTGFNQNQTYSHHAKIEETAKVEARVTVSIYSTDTDSAKNGDRLALPYRIIQMEDALFQRV